MGHAASYVEPRAGRGGAGAASGCVAVAGRARSGRNDLVVGGGLVAAEDRQPPRVLFGHGPDRAGELFGDRPRWAAPPAAGTTEGPGASRASDHALDRLLGQDRTWTAAQLAEALATEGIELSTRQTRKYLKWMDARWRRTVTTLAHKQDPARVDRAERTLATLKKSRPRVAFVWGISTSAASAPANPRR